MLKFNSIFKFVSVLLVVAPVNFAYGVDMTGVSKALKTVKIIRKDLETLQPGRPPTQECFVFPSFVAVQVDTGEKGAASIALRPRLKADASQEPCEAQKKPGDIDVPYNEQYVLGAADGFLVTVNADSFGNATTVWFYDSKTGKQIFEAIYDASQPITVTSKKGSTAVEFYKQLKLSCSVLEGKKECWTKILKDNNASSSARVGSPDCKNAAKNIDFKKYPELHKEPNVVQVFAKVKVPDIAKAKIEFVNSRATCNETP